MTTAATTRASETTGGFRRLEVVKKVRESSTITSFYLKPCRSQDWQPFDPGQYLVFRVPGPNGVQILRSYSVSSSPLALGIYRISVKREQAREPGQPDGAGSGFLHERTEVGDILLADGPCGAFVLDRTSMRPVVLLSGGVGLTPMVSMLHALAEGERRAWFIHACDSGDAHALRDEVERLVASRPGLFAHICYRFPSEADRVQGSHQSNGLLTRELLQSLLPLDDYDFYLCGPPPFMRGVYEILRSFGVPKARIAYEFFGPSSLLEPAAEAPAAPSAATRVFAAPEGATAVEFRRSGFTAIWNGSAGSLLAFAEDQGLSPEFSCRAGICTTCRTKLVEGEVTYFEDPLDTPAAGDVLICCAKPNGSVVLDL